RQPERAAAQGVERGAVPRLRRSQARRGRPPRASRPGDPLERRRAAGRRRGLARRRGRGGHTIGDPIRRSLASPSAMSCTPSRSSKRARVAAAAAMLCAAPATLSAQTLEPLLSGYVTLTTDYRHRGLSESSGEPSLQAGVDYQRANGLFAGAWAARIDYAQPSEDSSTRFKIGYYLGVSKRIGRWSWTATAVRYTYPGLAYDYDYGELSATVGFRDRLFFTTAYIDDVFGRDRSAVYGE